MTPHIYRIPLVVVLLMAASSPGYAQKAGRFPKTLPITTNSKAAGKVHFESASLAEYKVTGTELASLAGRVLAFQMKTWSREEPVFWDVYVVKERKDKAGNPGATTISRKRKVAGASQPGPNACVTLLALGNIKETEHSSSTQLAFLMAHEASHCFQRMASETMGETVAYDHADWFMEGSASWLAGDFVESEGGKYPSFFESALRKYHQSGLLELDNENHFFFKWLEGKQGLGSRAEVLGFVRTMLGASPHGCMSELSVEEFPDERGKAKLKDCPKAESPFPLLVEKFFAAKKASTARVMALFGSAIVRGTVPGIRAPNLFLGSATLTIQPGFNEAWSAFMLLYTEPAGLGKIQLLTPGKGMNPATPGPFGFVVFRVGTSLPLLPPPGGYLFAVEGGEPSTHCLLSRATSDDALASDRWVKSEYLESNWIAFARGGDAEAGKEARLLISALPASSLWASP